MGNDIQLAVVIEVADLQFAEVYATAVSNKVQLTVPMTSAATTLATA